MIDERRYLQLAVQHRYVTVDEVKHVCTEAGLNLSVTYEGARHVLLTRRVVTSQQDAALLDDLMGEPNDPTVEVGTASSAAGSGDSMVGSGDSMADAEAAAQTQAAFDPSADTVARVEDTHTKPVANATLLHVDGAETRRLRRDLEQFAGAPTDTSAPMASSTQSLPGWASSPGTTPAGPSNLSAIPAGGDSGLGVSGAAPRASAHDSDALTAPASPSPSSIAAPHAAWSPPPSSVPGDANASAAPSMTAAHGPAPGSVTHRASAQRFVHSGLLGRGGMGEVLLAVDDDLKREVAVKTLLKPDVRVLRDRFISEAQITGQLQHPNIVPVHELGVDDEQRPFLVMKRVRGRSLSDVLRAVEEEEQARKASGNDDASAGASALAELLGILEKVCNGVAYAHSRGVIHRDLKPDNIMVGEFGEVLVMDWGLAKVVRSQSSPIAVQPGRATTRARGGKPRSRSNVSSAGESDDGIVNRLVAANTESHDVVAPELHSVDGAIKGTPAYMAPEQAMGDVERVNERSDIYALGAILYQMLTLTSPVEAGSTARVLVAVANGEITPPSKRTPGRLVPRELEAVVMKAMALQPRRRYANVLEFRDDIVAYLTGRTLGAVQYSPIQRLSKWMRRNRAVVGGAIAVFLVAIAGLVAVALVQQQSEAEREQERVAQVREAESNAMDALETLRGELEDVLVGVKAAPTIDTMRLPNGELDHAAVDAFYAAHIEALTTLESLAELHHSAPTDRVREAIDLAAVDRQRRDLALAVSRAAAQLGDYTNARLWIERAVGAGLDPAQRASELASVDAQRKQAVNETLEVAEHYLSRAREGQFDEGEFDFALIDLTRRSGPALVRYLLDPAHLRSEAELEQRLVITLLGRLGDPVTKGTDGRDAVEALVDLLESTDVRVDTEIAYVLVVALGHLADRRAEGAVSAARERGTGLFRTRTAHAYARIPAATLSVDNMQSALDAADVVFQKGEFLRVIAMITEAMEQWGQDNIAALLMRGTAYYEMGRYQEALADFVRVTELDPDNAVGWGNTGNAYSHLDRLDDAIAAQTRSLELEPDAWTYCNRGSCLQQIGRIDQSIADYTEAIAMDGSFAQAYRFRGVSYLHKREFNKALSDINRSLDLEESWDGYFRRADCYRQMGHLDLALNDATKAIVLAPQAWQPYASRARVHQARGDLERAVEDFSSALALSTESPYVLLDRADALHSLDRYTEVLVDTGRLLKDYAGQLGDWHLGLLYFIRANSFHRVGDSAKAEEAYGLAFKHRPHEPNYRFFFGAMLVELGRFEEGLDHLDTAREGGEGQPALYFYRGRALDALGNRSAAIESYTAAIAVYGDHPESSYNRGMLYLEIGENEKAEVDFGEAARAPRMRAWSLTQRAETRLRLGNYDGALVDALEAVKDAEANAPNRRFGAYVVLGRVYLTLDDPAKAVEALARAVEIDKYSWMGWANYGDALDRTDRYDDARAAYDEALRLAPEGERDRLQRNRDAVGESD